MTHSAPQPVCFYFASTPFHYLAAETIKASVYPHAKNHLFYTRKEVINTIGSIHLQPEWQRVTYYPWPRLDPLPGRFGRHRRLLQNFDLLDELLPSPTEVIFISDQIVSEPINFSINYLRSQGHKVHVQLLPDGYMNFHRSDIPQLEQLGQYGRQLRRLVSPKLQYSRIKGDRTGIDHSMVEHIHLFNGTTNEYPADKVRYLPPLKNLFLENETINTDRVLVIGHANKFSAELGALYSTELKKLLATMNVPDDKVDYKAHPKCPQDDLWQPGFCVIQPPDVLELYLLKHRYQAIISIISSTLFNVPLFWGNQQRCIALGPNRVFHNTKGTYAAAKELLDSLKIEIIEI